MRAKRRNIQLELALEPEAKGEARSAGAQGTEARMARAEPERPAAGLEARAAAYIRRTAVVRTRMPGGVGGAEP